jgi:hypothetical protein
MGIAIALMMVVFAAFVTLMYTSVSHDLYKSVNLIKESKQDDNIKLSIISSTNLIEAFFITNKFWGDYEEIEKTFDTTEESTNIYTTVQLNDFFNYKIYNVKKGETDNHSVPLISETLSLIDDIDHLILNDTIYHSVGEKESLVFSIVQFK